MNIRVHGGPGVALVLITLLLGTAASDARATTSAPVCPVPAAEAAPEALAHAASENDLVGLGALAEAGDAQAAWFLARALVLGAPQDEEARAAAGHWLVCAADAGLATAAERLALDPMLIPEREARDADAFLLAAARAGLPSAQWRLGERLTLGSDGERDYGLARFWLSLAADGGDRRAQFTLAWLHEQGLGGAPDAAAAERRYRQAAAGGDERARNNLAWLLARDDTRLDEARTEAELAFDRLPAAPVADTLGWIHFRRGDVGRARYWLELSLSMDPDQADALDHLGDVCLASEDTAGARSAWRRALSLAREPGEIRALERKLAALGDAGGHTGEPGAHTGPA